jgi:predicted small metal-binding protein
MENLIYLPFVLVPGCNFRPSTQDIQEWEFAGLRYVVYRCMLSYAVDMPSLLALMFDELFLSSLVLVPGCNFRPSTQDIQEWEFAGLRYVVYRCMLSYAVDMPSLLALNV